MRPARTSRKALQLRRHFRRRDISYQHEVKPHQVNAHGLVRMQAAGVLNRVAVHRQLVRLPKKNGILELRSQDLLEYRPAFGRRVKLTGVIPLAPRHLEPASGAGSGLNCHGRRDHAGPAATSVERLEFNATTVLGRREGESTAPLRQRKGTEGC
jgi:hypothetical protein